MKKNNKANLIIICKFPGIRVANTPGSFRKVLVQPTAGFMEKAAAVDQTNSLITSDLF
jgi:hypothetical protein